MVVFKLYKPGASLDGIPDMKKALPNILVPVLSTAAKVTPVESVAEKT